MMGELTPIGDEVVRQLTEVIELSRRARGDEQLRLEANVPTPQSLDAWVEES